MMVQRTVLLTGAAGGLGRVMAKALMQDKHRVALIDTSEAGLDKLAIELCAAHPDARLLPLRLDLADDSGFAAAIARVEDALGPIDVLINNAGLYVSSLRDDFRQRPLRFWDIEAETLKRFFRVNAIAPMLLASRLVPGMIERRFGRIINVTTSLSTMIRKGATPYGGTKASLEAHSAIMAKDLEGTDVTVNVLVPGGASDTPMIPLAHTEDRSKLIPPTVMAQPLIWLMSDGASHITGRRIMAAQWKHNRPEDIPPTAWPSLP
jgi:NAD(P)-dependent dehydrogenase (short-subunit alcohol dehydrogenase family)